MGIFSGGLTGLGMLGLFGKQPKPDINLPGATPEETELMRSQNQFLQRQMSEFDQSQREADLIRPFLLSEVGVEEVRDASGNLTGYRKAALTPEQQQQQQIETKLRERTLAALEGNLPVDPKLERNLREGRINLGEQLRKQLGSGYETSTPGIEALANYDQRREELLFGARTGMLNTSEALAGARESRDFLRDQFAFSGAGTAGQYTLPFLSAGTTLSKAFDSPLTRMLQERGLGLEANKFSKEFQFRNFENRMRHYETEMDRFANIFGSVLGMGA